MWCAFKKKLFCAIIKKQIMFFYVVCDIVLPKTKLCHRSMKKESILGT